MIKISLPDFRRDPHALFEPDYRVEVSEFKGGEVNIRLPHTLLDYLDTISHMGQLLRSIPERRVRIQAHLTDSKMVMAFFMTVDALRRLDQSLQIEAFIPYLPYARQDRVCNRGEALSISMFAKMLNALELKNVILLDPHSDVAAATINNSTVIQQSAFLSSIFNLIRFPICRDLRLKWNDHSDPKEGVTWLIAPDAGAVKKVKAASEKLVAQKLIMGYMTATKTRNIETMDITETTFDGDVRDKDVLVVDDICDGGRTFIALGKKLREQGCKKLSLFVTHGIFSYGVGELLAIYDHIYTTTSFHPRQDAPVRVETEQLVNAEGQKRFHWIEV